MIFFIRFKVCVVVITKYEKKQAILVDFRLFSHEDDNYFAYNSFQFLRKKKTYCEIYG